MKSLEVALRTLRDHQRTALVPYFMAGATPNWVEHVRAAAQAGADAIEIGLPFSDPMMDGAVVQEAGLRAIEAGTTFDSVGQQLAGLDAGVPLIAMTYYNIFLHDGLERSAGRLQEFGFGGAIVPDLSLEESDAWATACRERDVATIFLVAPSTPVARMQNVTRASEGFVYAAARMAVTGASDDDGQAEVVVSRVRQCTDLPAYVGIGITTPAQAARTARVSDGVIVGSALVRHVLAGASARDVENFVQTFRDALDDGATD